MSLPLRAALLASLLVGTMPLGVQAAPPAPAFGIESMLRAPYPTSLVAAPVGRGAAWVLNVAGVRNIWVGADAGAARQLTGYAKDDGYDLGELKWSADAKMLAFTRGQTLEDDAPANVAGAPEGPSPREIWTLSLDGGAPRRIGAGHEPAFSPDGTRLVFLDKRQILLADPRGTAKPTPLVVDEGTVRAITWSPDGKRLAFVSQRRGHALIGVYDFSARSVTWLAPDFDIDSNPVFSPDGTQVAFVRAATEKVQPFVRRRTGRPWTIWAADAATGLGRKLWSADEGAGSVFRPTLSADNLLWSARGQLVFPWEKSGWLLPYAVSARGGAAHAIASGPFEIAYMTLDPTKRRLMFASNQGDIDRLHIWSADPAGGVATIVARDDGIEAVPQAGLDGALFSLRSTATAQLSPAVLDRGRWQPLLPSSAQGTFDPAALVMPQSVTFTAADGKLVHGQLFLQRGGGTGRRPAVMFFHGGPPRQMLLGFHYMSAYAWMYGMNQALAQEGYVVLSVNYRGGIGYGLDYREAEGFGAGGGSETNDLLGAVDYLAHRADVDPKRVGIWGGSYGGLMTALGLARASDRIAVGVDYAGVYDWASMLAVEGAPIEDPADKARAIASSPVATIDRWKSPVLVVQADDDRNVPFQQSIQLVQDLRAHGIPHDTLVLPNEVHDLTRYISWLALFNATDAYLGRYLRPAR